MSVRKVITRRSNHFRAYIPSLKNEGPAECESLLEAKFIRLCELSPLVLDYEVQPSLELISVDGRLEQYFPDLRVRLADGTERWIEVKPAGRLKVRRVACRMAAATMLFAQSGRPFRIVTDQQLNVEPRAANVLKLTYHRRGRLTPVEFEHFHHRLHRNQPRTLSDLFSLVGVEDAWRLLGLGVVGIDLDKPIELETVVYVEGGHRHADLFA
ncbi:TnsA endonuclease N-terminal domain-containing protein [Ralstonia solanacearum]|uniref:TnsA endonuclease N-terminal domain-containing protein n=1 Tax=Ralstonia solanacearum TaxID=305 RepID=UPI001E49A83E|nr:TnsA endonuclease N-terminal domain-containing protein [Ralstonia solanacearum]